MEEVYKSLITLAAIPPACYLTLRLMDYGAARLCYRMGYIEEEPTFSNAPTIVKKEVEKLNQKCGIKD